MPTIPKAKIEEWKALCAEMDELVARGEAQDMRRTLNRAGALASAVPALLAEREGLLSLLREVEWRAGTAWALHEQGTQPNRPACPVCWAEDEDGHAPDCRLAAFLKE